MYNLKEIRKDFDGFKNKLQSRKIVVDIENIKKLDKKIENLFKKKV